MSNLSELETAVTTTENYIYTVYNTKPRTVNSTQGQKSRQPDLVCYSTLYSAFIYKGIVRVKRVLLKDRIMVNRFFIEMNSN